MMGEVVSGIIVVFQSRVVLVMVCKGRLLGRAIEQAVKVTAQASAQRSSIESTGALSVMNPGPVLWLGIRS